MKTNKNLIIVASLFAGLSISAEKLPKTLTPISKDGTQSILTKKALAKASSSDDGPKGVIKINLSQLPISNLSFQGEYGFHKNMSGAIGFSYLLKRTFPAYFVDEDPTGEGLRNPTLKGFSITPEFRFYPGRKEEHQAPHGFYIAAYYRFAKYTVASNYTENYNNGKSYTYDLKTTYGGGTAGLMIGSQWLIGKHFSIDWWIIGAGSGKAKVKLDATTNYTMSDQEQAEVKSSVEGEFQDLNQIGFVADVTTTPNSVKAIASGIPMLSLRGFGLCIGFAF